MKRRSPGAGSVVKTPKPKAPPALPAGRILAFAGQKGGAGKTTSAIALATELHQRGRRVLLVDTDPQGSTRTWAAVATEQGVSIPTVIAMGAGLHQPEQLPRLAAGYDFTVVDCPPRLDALQREVLMVTDAVVIPCGPSAPEAWAMADATTLVRRAIELRPTLRAFVLITKKQPRTSVGAQARTMLEAVQLPLLASELCYRVTYQEALAAGQGPTTYAPKSAAAAEVRALANELVTRLAWKDAYRTQMRSTPELEDRARARQARLRELQAQQAQELSRTFRERLLMPPEEGPDILDRADQLLEAYEDLARQDPALRRADRPKA